MDVSPTLSVANPVDGVGLDAEPLCQDGGCICGRADLSNVAEGEFGVVVLLAAVFAPPCRHHDVRSVAAYRQMVKAVARWIVAEVQNFKSEGDLAVLFGPCQSVDVVQDLIDSALTVPRPTSGPVPFNAGSVR